MRTLVFGLLLLAKQSIAQSEINFFKGSWDDALAKARTENKLIFLNMSKSGCWDCTMMSMEVFKSPEVGDFFNKTYVNVKLDVEHYQASSLAKRFGIKEYPALLFIDNRGNLLHQEIGRKTIEEMLAIGRNALKPDQQIFTRIDRFRKQTMTAGQLWDLAQDAWQLGVPSEEVAVAYLKQNKNWMQPEIVSFMLRHISPAFTEGYQFLTNNLSDIRQLVDSVNYYLNTNLSEYAKLQANKEADIVKSVAIYEKVYSNQTFAVEAAKLASLTYGMTRAKESNEFDLSNQYLISLMAIVQDKMGARQLDEIAWRTYESLQDETTLRENDRQLLNAAVQWALKSIERESTWENNYTIARIYQKLGDKKNAKKYAKISLQLAKEAGEDIGDINSLLDEL